MTWQVGGAGGGVEGFRGWNQAGGEWCLWWGWSDTCLDSFLPSLLMPLTPVVGDIGVGDKARVGDIGLRASGGSGGFILTSCGMSNPSIELDLMVLSSIFFTISYVTLFLQKKQLTTIPINDNCQNIFYCAPPKFTCTYSPSPVLCCTVLTGAEYFLNSGHSHV